MPLKSGYIGGGPIEPMPVTYSQRARGYNGSRVGEQQRSRHHNAKDRIVKQARQIVVNYVALKQII